MGDMSREPSMEEILSSIRRVIARDDPAAAKNGQALPYDDSDTANGSAPRTLELNGSGRGNPGRQLTPMSAFDDDPDDDDVLELTEAEPTAAADPSAEPMRASPEAGDMPDPQIDPPEPVIASFPMPPAAAPKPAPVAPTASEPATSAPPASPDLVSRVSAAASRQSLDALAAALAGADDAPAAPAAAGNGDLSVNALVEAALRPMLKAWLDAHLPQMVERLVAREIARITGSRL